MRMPLISCRFLAFVGLAALLAGCGEWRGSRFTPTAPTREAWVGFQKSLSGGHVPAGHLYIDTDGVRGAERCVFFWEDGTWTLAAKKPGAEGLYDAELAAGAIGGDGVLVGFPEDGLRGARSAWREGNVQVSLNGQPVPQGD